MKKKTLKAVGALTGAAVLVSGFVPANEAAIVEENKTPAPEAIDGVKVEMGEEASYDEIANVKGEGYKVLTCAQISDTIKDNNGTWLGRSGLGEDIARAIVYLASDNASYVTGSDMAVDGGRTLGPLNPGFKG